MNLRIKIVRAAQKVYRAPPVRENIVSLRRGDLQRFCSSSEPDTVNNQRDLFSALANDENRASLRAINFFFQLLKQFPVVKIKPRT